MWSRAVFDAKISLDEILELFPCLSVLILVDANEELLEQSTVHLV